MQSVDLCQETTLHGGYPIELCHTDSVLQSVAIERLGQFVLEWRQQGANQPPDFEQFERELHRLVMALECELISEELARYDVTAEEIEVGGVRYRPALTSPEVSVDRAAQNIGAPRSQKTTGAARDRTSIAFASCSQLTLCL